MDYSHQFCHILISLSFMSENVSKKLDFPFYANNQPLKHSLPPKKKSKENNNKRLLFARDLSFKLIPPLSNPYCNCCLNLLMKSAAFTSTCSSSIASVKTLPYFTFVGWRASKISSFSKCAKVDLALVDFRIFTRGGVGFRLGFVPVMMADLV